MKNTLKQALLMSAVVGLTVGGFAQAATKSLTLSLSTGGAKGQAKTKKAVPAKQPAPAATTPPAIKLVQPTASNNGFYIAPEFQLIFNDKAFTRKLSKVGFGVGGGLSAGYKINNFLIDFSVDYQYYGKKGTPTDTTSLNGTHWVNGKLAEEAFLKGYQSAIANGKDAAIAAGKAEVTSAFAANPELANYINGTINVNNRPDNDNTPGTTHWFAGEGKFPGEAWAKTAARTGGFFYNPEGLAPTAVSTTVDSKEGFIPITLGLKYAIPIAPGNVVSLTPGIAGGVWFHTVDRSITTVVANQPPIHSVDKATETRGVIVPSLTVDYNPTPNLSFSLGGKFYLVPSGYSDNYKLRGNGQDNVIGYDRGFSQETPSNQRFASDDLPFGLEGENNRKNKFFWYGAITLAGQYKF
ncbi:MAG: hypothetical protein QM529_04185 [Hydrotalea sp.]|nr:hypothetical protein [Hydrotalea sp.]